MGEKIGVPLVEEVGRPRVLPKTLPRQVPVEVPQEVPEKEKVPVHVGTPVENLIHRVATFLGVPDAWLAAKVLTIADCICGILDVGAKRKSMVAKAR